MRRSTVVLLGVLCAAAWAASACSRGETVTGQLVDLYCYNVETKENAGMDHTNGRECAWACAKWEGQPVGLLTVDGRLYQLTGGLVADNNAKVAPHITHTVTITGKVTEEAGMMMLASNDLTMAAAQ